MFLDSNTGCFNARFKITFTDQVLFIDDMKTNEKFVDMIHFTLLLL